MSKAKASRRRGPSRLAEPDETRQLNAKQLNAVELIVQGHNDREVAEAVGVTRQTVCEWRNHNAEVVARVNDLRRQVWGSQTDRLRGLLVKAVDVLERELDGEKALTAAVHVLRSLGLYGGDLQPRGPVCPGDIRAQQAGEEASREMRQLMSSLPRI